MKKYIIGLFLFAVNIEAFPSNVIVRSSIHGDVPVLVFQGLNCDNERLINFMDLHKVSPIKNEDPYKAWASVQWAKLKDMLAIHDPLKRQPASQCEYISQGFLGATDYTTPDTFARLGYIDIKGIPSAEKPKLLALRAKEFKIPNHVNPIKVVFYGESSAHIPAEKHLSHAAPITVCDALPGQEVVISKGIGNTFKCTVK